MGSWNADSQPMIELLTILIDTKKNFHKKNTKCRDVEM